MTPLNIFLVIASSASASPLGETGEHHLPTGRQANWADANKQEKIWTE